MSKRLLSAAIGAAGVLVTLVALTLGAGPARAQSATGTVYVVHGIPGVAVDVYVDGASTLPNFTPTTVAGPLTLPAKDYAITIFATGADPATATPVISKTVTLPAGANVSLVAHLDAAGTPVLTAFVNDTAAAAAGSGRLVVRHTAAAPAVDVLAGSTPAFTNLTNPNQAATDLPEGTISASVVAAGTTAPALIGPADVPVTAGMATIVYAIGAPASGSTASTLGVVTQQVALDAPAMLVQAGTSGLQDTSGVPVWAFAGLGLALGGLALVGRSAARARA